MYNLSYGNLAGLFVEAIKEQQVQIEELKREIEELKNGSSHSRTLTMGNLNGEHTTGDYNNLVTSTVDLQVNLHQQLVLGVSMVRTTLWVNFMDYLKVVL